MHESIYIENEFHKIYNQLKQEDRLTYNALATHFKCGYPRIDKLLKHFGLRIDKKLVKYNRKDLMKDVQDGTLTRNDICDKHNISVRSLKTFCAQEKLDFSSLKTKKDVSTFKPDNHEEFVEYVVKYGKMNAAKKYDCSLASVVRYVNNHNVVVDPYKGSKSNISKEDILSLIEKKYLLSQIANELNTSIGTVQRLVKRYNIDNYKTATDLRKSQRQYIADNLLWILEENKKRDMLDISKELDIHHSTLLRFVKDSGHNVIMHSCNKSKGEIEVRDYIRQLGVDCFSTKHKHNNIVYEIDCYVPEKSFAVEYCGEYWHSYNAGKDRNYHHNKYEWCKSQGITLLTIFEHEWLYKRAKIESIIRNKLGMSVKIGARQTACKKISSSDARKFHEDNHINGYINSSLNYGLFYKDQLIMCMSFSKSRFDKRYQYEITRMSSLIGHTVVGGISKIIKHANIKSIMTYVDKRFGDGNGYDKVGFSFIGNTPPNYWYFHKATGCEFESRIKYQKHKLKQFAGFDISKTEYDIMSTNGYLKIYDCGNLKYVL